MGTNMATLNGEVSQEQLEYYELRAKGGTGLITIENICIDFLRFQRHHPAADR